MFILPFLHKKISNTPIHVVQFFLAKGGTTLLSVSSDPAEFCKENDIPLLSMKSINNINFIKVNPQGLQKEVFYSYNEEDTQELEVWRTFVWVGDATTDPWSVNSSLEKVLLSGSKASSLVEAVLRTVA
jgi:hypothetical protein